MAAVEHSTEVAGGLQPVDVTGIEACEAVERLAQTPLGGDHLQPLGPVVVGPHPGGDGQLVGICRGVVENEVWGWGHGIPSIPFLLLNVQL